MNYTKIRKLKNKPFFKLNDLCSVLNISFPYAKLLANRYTKKGFFIRLKKDFYVLKERWDNSTTNDFYRISNYLQVPSYISFMTALSYFDITTQLQQNFIENACTKRSKTFDKENITFNYYKLKQNLYFGFNKLNNIFIAEKEKALVDCIYLFSFGKYKFDIDSIDFSKFDKTKLSKYLKFYPKKTIKVAKKICKI